MMCKHPFMRDPKGRVFWSKTLTREQRLQCTPFPCGRCLPCKINNQRVWKHRLILESMVHQSTIFVSLDYSEDFIPAGCQLYKEDLIKFLKKLRSRINKKFRHFGVGEYGNGKRRGKYIPKRIFNPHYHLMLFGLDYIHKDEIEKSWTFEKMPMGRVSVGDFNNNTASYITKYVVKKLTKKDDKRLQGRTPEFMTSSRKDGGIGYGAIKKIAENLKKDRNYKKNIIDQLIHGSKSYPLGRYLTDKINQLMEVNKNDLEVKFNEFHDDLVLKHMKLDGSYYFNIVKEKENQRLSQKKRVKIYEQNRKLHN